MDDNRVRTYGLVGGGAALVVALGLAVLGREQQVGQVQPDPPPAIESQTAVPTPSVAASAPIPSVETAASADAPPVAVVRPDPAPARATPPQNPNLEFLVRFDDRHPMSRAQALWLQGKHADAEALARSILPQRPELRGLCFSRFTLGAEIIFALCSPVPRAQIARTSDRWERKLRAIRGVQYCDANVVADVERR